MNAPERVPLGMPPELHGVTDDPRYIGASVSRPGARRLVEGRGTYVDDIKLPRMAHVVYCVRRWRIAASPPSTARPPRRCPA